MSESWKQEFRRALIDTLIKNGDPVPSHSMNIAHNYQEIRDTVTYGPVDYAASRWTDDSVWTGADTFNEGQLKAVLVLTVVMTNGDGPFTFRYEGNVSDLIGDMMREMGES